MANPWERPPNPMMGNRTLVLVTVLNAFLVACASRSTTVLAEDLEVGPGATRLDPKPAVEAAKYFNGVQFEIGPTGSHGASGGGFRLDDGTLAIPEAEVVDQRGKRHALTEVSYGSSGGHHFLSLYSRELPKDAKFVAVMLRSNVSFRTPQVIWASWDPK